MNEDRAFRVMPLAQRALDILLSEEDVEVRLASVKLIKVAAEHWPEPTRSQQKEKANIRQMAGFIKDYTGGRRLKDYLKEVADE